MRSNLLGPMEGYVDLRGHVARAGLLRRAERYYTWRSAVSFAFLGAGVCAALTLPIGPASAVLASAALAFGSVQVALVGHDAGHQAVFNNRRANFTLGWICWTLVLGISFWYWCDRHNRHHANTNDISADPDLSWGGLVAYSDAIVQARADRPRWLVRHQALLGPGYALGLAFAFRAEGWAFAFRRLTGFRRALELIVMGAWIIVWVSPVAAIGWWWCLPLLVGQVLAGVYLAAVIAPNHKGMPVWSSGGAAPTFLERQVLSSRNITPHPVGDFVFGGLNYQIEHHLFPSMPRVHLRAARTLVKAYCQSNGLPYQEVGVLTSYRMVLAELRRVGRNAMDVSKLAAPSVSASSPTVK